ncbi:phage tail tube protein [Nonomuraea jiangxiensis]|uniref:Phage tail tube protein n=1 Tax=Nonomuraea jiangxiensis TaxID=633440 RepID=A0A1G8UJE2_9ACTN|nr:hypothetical protein [Nonomuraea jiangxiensis]SDJ53952.1 hypothetical protein SAMN05421869_1119 [Nonomuraea jiangxiensis]
MRSLLARDWKLDVDTYIPGATEPTWTPVKGLTSFERSSDDNTEEDGDFDDEEGYGSSVVTGRTWQIEAEGRRKRTDDTVFTPDPGQEKILKVAQIVGFNANIWVCWCRRDGAPDAYEGTRTVTDYTEGGETTDLEPFSFTLLGQGSPTEIANPVTEAP